METACLRIKFTPLLKESEKHNSKCCLEIVPEVSHIQNFDKLTWKKDTNCIEYIVPMTYKIILRKLKTAADKNDEIIRTYYSCVDLLLSTSQSNYDLASGDVSGIISDTFIFSKMPPTTLKKDYFISNLVDDVNDVTQSGTATYETFTTLDLKDLSIKETGEEVANNGITKSTSQSQCYIDNIEITLCDKNTNTDTISAVYTYDIDLDVPAKKRSGPAAKRTLSVPPMISVKPQGTSQTLSRSTVSKAVTCNIQNLQRNLVLVEPTNTLSDVSDEVQLSKNVCKLGDISRNTIKSLFSTSTNQYSPAMRIAQYIKYMETELLPLNILLDKLITKCSILGVNKIQCISTKTSSNNLLLYKSVSTSKCKDNITETCEKSISNRAVFSIISDD